jgi:hypothetical protein
MALTREDEVVVTDCNLDAGAYSREVDLRLRGEPPDPSLRADLQLETV